MAKRKRLSPALLGGFEQTQTGPIDPVRGSPPIAQVVGETASQAAFADVAGALAEAREDGRLIVKLPLDAIETAHLVRDRIAFESDEMDALKRSLAARGQQVPIEVVLLAGEGAERYGLISGLRRVMALRDIGAREVLALIRQPETSAAAYLAMVEENEIRAGVSFYERARVASEAARLGLFETIQGAIAHLFAQASPAKRSKIGSFVAVHEALGAHLRFPTAIPERLGLAMAKALSQDRDFARQLAADLGRTDPQSAAQERGAIENALRGGGKPKPKPVPAEIAPGVYAERGRGRLVLTGPAVTEEMEHALTLWLKSRV